MNDRHELSFTFCCIINAPVGKVFETITDKAAISTFFTDASSASLAAGRTVFWRFGDLQIDVHVEEVFLMRESFATGLRAMTWATGRNSPLLSRRGMTARRSSLANLAGVPIKRESRAPSSNAQAGHTSSRASRRVLSMGSTLSASTAITKDRS